MKEITIRLSNKITNDVIVNTSMTTLVDTEQDAEEAGEWFYKMFVAISNGFSKGGGA